MHTLTNIKIQSVGKSHCTLGESPVWCEANQTLFWVDILENIIYSYQAEEKKINSWKVHEHVGFFVVMSNGNLVAGLKSGLHHVYLNNDGKAHTARIDRIDSENINIRFNDGMIDSKDRIWCCTMDMKAKNPLGKYYRYDTNLNRSVIDEGYTIANGPTLSPNESILYTVETFGNDQIPKGVYAYNLTSFDCINKPRKLLIDWTGKNTSPDGIVSDHHGNLWIGEFGGNVLRCYSPNGQLKLELALPAWNITKIAIRYAPHLIIYAASARLGVSENILGQYPLTGNILEITGIDEYQHLKN
ncbi:MAG TPA: SMP-30/gluconolactonase/LRE family protein [Flavitalea sp.]|nr:SMP-30/gluconolactonase/LRE family protein [Flavitalea sp.]